MQTISSCLSQPAYYAQLTHCAIILRTQEFCNFSSQYEPSHMLPVDLVVLLAVEDPKDSQKQVDDV